MRILQIEKFFYDRGGSSRVFFDTIAGLQERGHQVSEFSMLDEKNRPSEFAKYFAPHVPELGGSLSLSDKLSVFKHLFSSKKVVDKLAALIADTHPEVAHIHNAYHQLSASTFTTLYKKRVPMVMTVHDVFPLCPNHSLMVGGCLREDLLKNKLYNCVRYRCVQNKFLPSLAGTLEAYYYRAKKIWQHIDRFICPSQFMKDKLVEYGFPEGKMRVIRNFFTLANDYPPLGDKIVYLGRIHEEKGIRVFLEAVKLLPELPFVVAGSGPDDAWADAFIKRAQLTNVERHGWVSGEAWQNIMRSAKVIVVPSVFLENCSVAILEAFNAGRIVVATDRGGNPELVIDGKTGFLAAPEDAEDLARVIRTAYSLPIEQAKHIVMTARHLVKEQHKKEAYFSALETVYQEIIK